MFKTRSNILVHVATDHGAAPSLYGPGVPQHVVIVTGNAKAYTLNPELFELLFAPDDDESADIGRAIKERLNPPLPPDPYAFPGVRIKSDGEGGASIEPIEKAPKK